MYMHHDLTLCALLMTLFGVSLIFLMILLAPHFMKPNNFSACWLMAWNTAAVLMLEPLLAVILSVLSSVVWEWVCDLTMSGKREKKETRDFIMGTYIRKFKWTILLHMYMYMKILKLPIIIMQKCLQTTCASGCNVMSDEWMQYTEWMNKKYM